MRTHPEEAIDGFSVLIAKHSIEKAACSCDAVDNPNTTNNHRYGPDSNRKVFSDATRTRMYTRPGSVSTQRSWSSGLPLIQTGTSLLDLRPLSRQISAFACPNALDMPASKLDLSALALPPLPKFISRSIREQVFTHRSLYARPTQLFEDSVEDPSPDNEKFEHLGDTVIALVVTTLLNDLYPGLRVGPATKARSMIVGNATLADISVAYKLPAQLRLHPAQTLTLLHSTSVQADVFESFVGGLYVDQGMDIVQPWLRELLRPLCCQAYNSVKQQHGIIGPSMTTGLTSAPSSPSGCVTGDTITTGHLALFNQQLQKSGRTVEWTYSSVSVDEMAGGSGPIANGNSNDSDASTNRSSSPISSSDSASVLDGLRTTPMWSATVKVDGEFYGSGKGVAKRLARNEAAKMGLQKLGINV